MRRIFKVVLLMLTLTLGFALPAHAETPPPTITSNVVDKTGKIDVKRAQMMVDQVRAETDYELYVYFTDSFDGQSGAQWVDTAYRNAKLGGTNAVLYVIATNDRLYGSSAVKNTSAYANLSVLEKAAIPALKKADWTGAIEAYGNALLNVAHPAPAPPVDNSKTDAATAGFIGVVGWVIAALAGLALLVVGAIFGGKGISVLRAKNEKNRANRKELNKLKVSIPASISKLDENLTDLSNRLAFAVGMFGVAILSKAKNAEQVAKSELQAAISALGEVSSKERSASDVSLKLKEMNNVKSIVSSGERNLTTANKTIADAEALQVSVETGIATVKSLSADVESVSAKEEETLKFMSAQFDAEYVAPAVATERKLTQAAQALKASVASADTALAGQSLEGAQRALELAQENAQKAVSAHKAHMKALEDINGFAQKRKDSLKKIQKEITAMNEDNAHKDVIPLIANVEAAMVAAESIPADRGNPVKAFNDVLGGAVAEYRVKVAELVEKREMWIELNRSTNRFFTASSRNMEALKNAIDSLRIPVSAADSQKMRIADETIRQMSAEYDAAVNKMSGTPDLSVMKVVVSKVESEVSSALGALSSLTASVQAAKRKRAEEEEAAKRKKAEEARRAKRRREEEEEERRRRNSYSSSSSSSSYGYAAGYSSSSYSSSSYDSGSSGGSFSSDSGSSGGSF